MSGKLTLAAHAHIAQGFEISGEIRVSRFSWLGLLFLLLFPSAAQEIHAFG